MKRVLVSNLIMTRDIDRFRPELAAVGVEAVVADVRQFLTEEELLPIIGGFDGVLAGDDQFTERVLEAALPRLKVISKWGVGIDSIDLEAAKRLGIQVFNSPGAFGDAVAELAIAYMVMLDRKACVIDREVRAGKWPKYEGQGLVGKTLGVIGHGAIGRGVTKRAAAFGMKIIACDPCPGACDCPGVESACFDDVVAGADYLVLACNLTEENRHCIAREQLGRMRPGARLVNVSRGPLVKEADLIEALQQGVIAGAALDVFETEPVSVDNPLAGMDNVVLGSHNANNVSSANEYVNKNTIANLLKGLGL